ncbi:unnamed protein product [Withania somnifera]
MAWNQGEGSSAGTGSVEESLRERWLNDKVSDGFDEFWYLNWEKEDLDDDGHKGGKSNRVSDEIADLLPPDPFNMESRTEGSGSTEGSGITAMKGWLEDFEKDFELNADKIDIQKLDAFLTGKRRIQQDARLQLIDGNSELSGMYCSERLDGGRDLIMDGKKENIDFSYGKYWNLGDTTNNDHCDNDGGNPSDAVLLALGYLGLGDLLTVERVCKPLRDAVIGDPLLWRSININYPFCTKITDDILLKLSNRAQGHLHSLSLYHCSKITDAGLKHVLERNPNLSKLSVPGCARLTADGILSNLKVLKTAGKLRLKYLGIYGLFGLTNQHIEEFKLLTDVDNSKLPTTRKPWFFGRGPLHVTPDDDRAMDIEVCPKCEHLELVYDCPSESCQKKQSSSQLCRACTTCIKRCISCGCCLNNCHYMELLHFDLLCLDCQGKPLGCQKGEKKKPFLSQNSVVHKGGLQYLPLWLGCIMSVAFFLGCGKALESHSAFEHQISFVYLEEIGI